MSLRARLSLVVVGSVALGLLLVTVTAHVFLSRRVYRETDRALADRAEVVAAGTRAVRDVARLPSIDNLVDATTFIQVVDAAGDVKASTNNLPEGVRLPVDGATLAVARDGATRARTVTVNGVQLRLVESPLSVDDGRFTPQLASARRNVIGVVQVARSIDIVQSGLRTVRVVLVVGGVGAFLLAGGLALVLTRAALRPLASMRSSAEEVAATGDPGRRLRPATQSNDEVARLASAFDRMLERLEESGSALGAALESQRRFVADASHELRTPITSARGNLEVVLRNPDMDPSERARAIAEAGAELERMGRLVDGLLTLARADAGRLPDPEPVVLAEVLERSHRSAARRAGRRRFELHGDLDGAEVSGSSDVLRRLFDNLYDNAIKYTGPEGSVVTSAEVHDRWATVSVADDGPGIPPAELPHVFERFYRSPGARGAEGSGLGLAIVQWAATLHGGSVAVSSAPGEGSTFVVTLPVKAPEGIAPTDR